MYFIKHVPECPILIQFCILIMYNNAKFPRPCTNGPWQKTAQNAKRSCANEFLNRFFVVLLDFELVQNFHILMEY